VRVRLLVACAPSVIFCPKATYFNAPGIDQLPVSAIKNYNHRLLAAMADNSTNLKFKENCKPSGFIFYIILHVSCIFKIEK
jgi:hypothetical protein